MLVKGGVREPNAPDTPAKGVAVWMTEWVRFTDSLLTDELLAKSAARSPLGQRFRLGAPTSVHEIVVPTGESKISPAGDGVFRRNI